MQTLLRDQVVEAISYANSLVKSSYTHITSIVDKTKITPRTRNCSFYFTEKSLGLTVFENHRKSLIQHCERSELGLHFEWTKVN